MIIACQDKIVVNKNYLPIKTVMEKDHAPYYIFEAKGGERHISLIDWGEDALPTSAGSCHHGGEIFPPQKGIIKATTDNTNLYLDISWDDKTKDSKTTQWDKKSNKWIIGKDDGIGIMLSKKPDFDCTTTCHMTSWEVGNSKFSSDYRMFTNNPTETYPIVFIRHKKTHNKPIFAIINKVGKFTPHGKPIYKINSYNLADKAVSLNFYQNILRDDRPLNPEEANFFILNEENHYLEGYMKHSKGRWHAHIVIPLKLLDINKKGDKIYLALALFDNTDANHSITKTFLGVYE